MMVVVIITLTLYNHDDHQSVNNYYSRDYGIKSSVPLSVVMRNYVPWFSCETGAA